MIERIIRSLGDTSLKTREKFYALTPGEIVRAQFRDEKEYNRLLTLHVFEPATELQLVEFQSSFIPVIPMESQTNIFIAKPEPPQEVVPDVPVEPPAKIEVVKPSAMPKASIKVQSRCPKCGRVKTKDTELCKQCSSDTL